MQSDHSTQLLHWLNQPPSFALGGKGSPRSQSVIPAHIVHPSSRLPLDVQHLLEFLPPGSSVSYSCTGSWPQLIQPWLSCGPHLLPWPWFLWSLLLLFDPCLLSLLVLLVLLAATAVGVATTPVGAPHGPLLLLLSPGPVCARTPRSSSLPLLLIRHLLL